MERLLPKSIWLILLIQIFGATDTLLTGRFLKSLSDIQYFISYEVIIIIILTIVLITRSYFKNLKGINKSFYGFRLGNGFLENISRIIYLFVVGNLGVVMSVLLSFIGTGITMLFGRIFLKEKPTKKNIIMCVIVAVLVLLGFVVG